MIFRVVIIICIFIAFTFIGYVYGESFKKRVYDLQNCYKGVLLLQNEVVYNMTPLPEALGYVGEKLKGYFGNLFMDVSKDLDKGNYLDVYSSFKERYKGYSEEFYLNEEDKRVFSDFLRSLGDSGVYGQDKVFTLALENIKININEASELSKKNTKLYRYLGMCFGAMISILLL